MIVLVDVLVRATWCTNTTLAMTGDLQQCKLFQLIGEPPEQVLLQRDSNFRRNVSFFDKSNPENQKDETRFAHVVLGLPMLVFLEHFAKPCVILHEVSDVGSHGNINLGSKVGLAAFGRVSVSCNEDKKCKHVEILHAGARLLDMSAFVNKNIKTHAVQRRGGVGWYVNRWGGVSVRAAAIFMQSCCHIPPRAAFRSFSGQE
eukprot:1961675-Amphidinium_carterae.1